MVRTGELEFVIDCPWDAAILAFQSKFWKIPNPKVPEVKECKFSNIKYDAETGITSFRRFGRVAMNAPRLLLRVAGTDELIVWSDTTIDRKKKMLVSKGWNETFRPRLELDEVTTFQPHPEDATKTLLTLKGTLSINISFLGIGMLEKFVVNKYKDLAKKGREMEKEDMAEYKERYKSETPPMCKCEIMAREEYEKQKAGGQSEESKTADGKAEGDASAASGGAGSGEGAGAGAGAGAGTAGAGAAATSS